MPQPAPGTGQSDPINQENEKPHSSTSGISSSQTNKDDEDFVDIEHEDVEMQDTQHHEPAHEELGLQRLSANSADNGEDDDSEEEADNMASHPLLSMLTGRLGQRRRGSNHKWDSLHPVTQVLSPANVDDCTELEATAFPEHERCSREKVRSR
jgi:hypothetical protein